MLITRLERIRQTDYLVALDQKSNDELRSMRDDCVALETEASYLRRLAQGRIDILRSEQTRRESGEGGSLDGLINDLPRILAGDAPRVDPTHSRIPALLDPPEVEELGTLFPDLTADTTLAQVPTMTDADLVGAIARFGEAERAVSAIRQELHGVIGSIEAQLTKRLQAGSA
jgi:hypothetical protein